MDMNSTITVGMDLADKETELCVLGGEGDVIERRRIRTTKEGISWVFSQGAPRRVVMEVGTHSPWVSRLLSELGHEVIVANARRVQLIGYNIRKDDTTDAELLARLGRADPALLAPIIHRSEGTQTDRLQIRTRAALVTARTQLINSVRGQAKALGIQLPKCSAEKFCKLQLPEGLRGAFAPTLVVIGTLSEQIAIYDERIAVMATERYPESESLQAVKGVGAVTAVAFVTTLEEASRFKNGRAVAAYLGLVPRRRQTGGRDPELGITKAGDEYLRLLLVQCAQRILGPFGQDSALRRWGLKLVERGGKGAKKKAIVAVARKLAIVLYRLWVSGAAYEAFPQQQGRSTATA